jgi:hypothetical protein
MLMRGYMTSRIVTLISHFVSFKRGTPFEVFKDSFIDLTYSILVSAVRPQAAFRPLCPASEDDSFQKAC